jgi:deoxyribodipyrimidine photo-lyase
MPESVLPFGSDRFESEIQWTRGDVGELFPPALDLDSLDLAASQALRSWLVAHINITARKSPPGKTTKTKPEKVTVPENYGDQLDFLEDLSSII